MPCAKGSGEVASSAAARGIAEGNMREILCQEEAQEAWWAALRVAKAEVRALPKKAVMFVELNAGTGTLTAEVIALGG